MIRGLLQRLSEHLSGRRIVVESLNENSDVSLPFKVDVQADASLLKSDEETSMVNSSDLNVKNIPYLPPIAASQQDIKHYLKKYPASITFIHGKAGCGKTFLLKQLEEEIPGCLILTPTNLARSMYVTASTIHSFFWGAFDNLDEGYQNPSNLDAARIARIAPMVKGVRMLVIDEISMVRADTFEMINAIFQKVFENNRPFGGISVVVVGDLFQLPPVVSSDAVFKYLIAEYGGIYFFYSHVVRENIETMHLFELTKSYRQEGDADFVEILDAFRRPMSNIEKTDVLTKLNTRVVAQIPDNAVTLASSNDEVDVINNQRLADIESTLCTVPAEISILDRRGKKYVHLLFDEVEQHNDIRPVVISSTVEPVLQYKIGAKVMITCSNKRSGYANGDFGFVRQVVDGKFFIELEKNGAMVCIPEFSNQMISYRYDIDYDECRHKLLRRKQYVQKTIQYPIKPAYAFTIHKSQGQTYEKMILDLSSHIFAPGQLYVALSRVKSLQGLYLTQPVSYSDIIADETIFDFLYALRKGNGNGDVSEEQCVKITPVTLTKSMRNFLDFVRMKEENSTIREFLLHTVKAYSHLIEIGNIALAYLELKKIISLIVSTYRTEKFDRMITELNSKSYEDEKECEKSLNLIFEIYTDVINAPRKNYCGDVKTLPENTI